MKVSLLVNSDDQIFDTRTKTYCYSFKSFPSNMKFLINALWEQIKPVVTVNAESFACVISTVNFITHTVLL